MAGEMISFGYWDDVDRFSTCMHPSAFMGHWCLGWTG